MFPLGTTPGFLSGIHSEINQGFPSMNIPGNPSTVSLEIVPGIPPAILLGIPFRVPPGTP